MVLPGHLSGGYLAAKALLALSPSAAAALPHADVSLLIIIGVLAGEAPDIDLIKVYMLGKRKGTNEKTADLNHRYYLTHAPLLWLFVCGALAVIFHLLGPSWLFAEMAAWMALAGSWSHFILDSIEGGIMWLWPFSKNRFALHHSQNSRATDKIEKRVGSIGYHWEFISKHYLRMPLFYIEIAITAAAIAAFFLA